MKRKQLVTDTGLPAVGDVPWGSHFCIFYETKRDLLDILVRYFEAGLEGNEACLSYVGSYGFPAENDAKEAVGALLADFDRLSKQGNVEIVSRGEWFLSDGHIDIAKAAARFQKKLHGALVHGFEGLRAQASAGAWLRFNRGKDRFYEYERQVDCTLANQRMIIACTFPLVLARANHILDAVRTHQFAVTVRRGVWKRVEINDADDAWRECGKGELQELTFRQREVLQLLAEEKTTKETAELLGISIKTVEAHRLLMMRRLKIDNVPGLVRFAIRTGLVSADV